MKKNTKNKAVLFLLFIGPLLFYLLLSTGINNFGKLPVVNQNKLDISVLDSMVTLDEKISILCFLGNDIQGSKGRLFNLNQEIYKPFYKYKNFQLVAIYPEGNAQEMEVLKKEINTFTNMTKWKFVNNNGEKIKQFYDTFNTSEPLVDLYSTKVFIIDKKAKLRGRIDDKDSKNGVLFGYDMTSVAVLRNKMKDDVKVLLAEYRLALKKNNADREI